MNRSVALPGGASFSARSALSLLALIAVVALAVHLVFGAGGLLNRTHVPPGLSLPSAGLEDPPVHQSASVSCFRSAPAVTAVRADHNDVFVRFVGQASFMKIQFLKSEDAAIRYSYAHGSPNNFYNNTNWFNTPAHLSKGDLDALGGCLPTHKSTS